MGLFGKKKILDENQETGIKKQEEPKAPSKVSRTNDMTAKTAVIKKATETKEVPKKKLRAAKKPLEKKSEKAALKKKAGRQAYRVLRRPLITEKSASLASEGVYVFEVNPSCGKVEVKHAVKELYGVLPRRVNVVAMGGKRVRFGRRHGVRHDWKKAFVFLKKGDMIDVFDAK